MMDERIGIIPQTRRRVWIGLGVFSVIWAAPWAAFALPMARRGDMMALGPVTIFLVVWVPTVVYLVSLVLGTTVIKDEGLRLDGMFSRGFIPWDRVADIQPVNAGRGSGYWIVRVRLKQGRSRKLPGLYAEGRSFGGPPAQFETNLNVVRNAWRRSKLNRP
ncbi:hypothetical protein [Actinomadura rupiterrae]|uniref:hypothetical protein n=1 Tax=Actinomadura rupiterrae TaxID=559627 RepID=UPI0020A46A6F|nr:hypothetical protein [Actinomadura rupiterrae]MCP2337699.1 hypothetical protein [Actinomadura rupiterrae]